MFKKFICVQGRKSEQLKSCVEAKEEKIVASLAFSLARCTGVVVWCTHLAQRIGQHSTM